VIDLDIKNATEILNILRSKRGYAPPFEIIGQYRLIDAGDGPEATVILRAHGREMHEADTGVGPVDALAKVLIKSLKPIFPVISRVKLIDFKSRIFDSKTGTAAKVEVEITFSDTVDVWRVTAFSENINKASFLALVDGFEYAIVNAGSGKEPEASQVSD
jgi:2-isopropylmalate synthase